MKRLTVLLLVLGVSGVLAQTPPRRLSRAEFEQAMKDLSNWGRWGTDDQLGTVNLLTPAARKAAAALVTDGVSISLSHELNATAAIDNPTPFVDRMLPEPVDDKFNMDVLTLPVHGFPHTHLDALSHVFYQGRMYNGVPESAVTADGASRLGVGVFGAGFFGRGVLIDMAWLKGTPYLEPGAAIFPADLDAWERKTGVSVRAGDIVFLRTGRWARRAAKGPWDISILEAGLDASTARWFKSRDIAVFGSDGAGDVLPSGIDGVDFPLHELFIVAMGTPMLDQCDLEDVAKAAVARGRWTFLVTAAPLRAGMATGSPLNIVATF